MSRFLLACALLGCGAPVVHGSAVVATQPGLPASRTPRIPRVSVTLVDAPERSTVLRGDDECADCHPDAAAQWGSSAHAWASMSNPIYRVSFDRFREASGEAASEFCGGCHDPALLVEDAMAPPIAASDPRARAGVGCRTCHGIAEAALEGNGSYRLAPARLEAPDVDDAASVAAHRRAVSGAALRTAELCASCHRGSLGKATGHPHAIAGIDDVGPWLRSAYAGASPSVDEPVTRSDCGGCHMRREAARRGDLAADRSGTIASHRFAGGHTWLAAMLGDAEQLEAQRAMLREAVRASVAVVEASAQSVTVDVVVRNTSVGHRFPGGTRDAQDTWIDVEITDANGRTVARTRAGDEHRLRAILVDGSGKMIENRDVAAIRAVVVDHTIPPRGARLSRHRADFDGSLDYPLAIRARVLHRSRNETIRAATCDDATTTRGRAFAGAAPRRINGCVAAPITTVAAVNATVSTSELPTAVSWRAAFEHGLALAHDVQENLGASDTALRHAVVLAPPRALPQILAARADIASQQGRVEEALALADAVATLTSDTGVERRRATAPALAWLRAQALLSVWRFDEARPFLDDAGVGLSRNDAVWTALARTCGSLGDAACALQAATAGLALGPRNAALLRAQALALDELGLPEADAAFDAYLQHREPDELPALRQACKVADPVCALEARPVHVHKLE